jgi:mannose-6-phosphate isomerase-like protein (cupin superfamily)
MKPQTEPIKKAAGQYDVKIIMSARQTIGCYSLLEVDLHSGGGNEMHYHTSFSESFEVISGTLSVQIGKEIKQLHPGDSCTVQPLTPHRFFNASASPTVFRCTIKPSRNFETAIRIGMGLEKDGLTNKKGIPKNFWHAILLFDLSESYLCGPPRWLQTSVFGGLARVARWLGADKALMKYY